MSFSLDTHFIRRFVLQGRTPAKVTTTAMPAATLQAYSDMIASEWREVDTLSTSLPPHNWAQSGSADWYEAYKYCGDFDTDGTYKQHAYAGAVAYRIAVPSDARTGEPCTIEGITATACGDRWLAEGALVSLFAMDSATPPSWSAILAATDSTEPILIADGNRNNGKDTETQVELSFATGVDAPTAKYVWVVLRLVDYLSHVGSWIEGGALLMTDTLAVQYSREVAPDSSDITVVDPIDGVPRFENQLEILGWHKTTLPLTPESLPEEIFSGRATDHLYIRCPFHLDTLSVEQSNHLEDNLNLQIAAKPIEWSDEHGSRSEIYINGNNLRDDLAHARSVNITMDDGTAARQLHPSWHYNKIQNGANTLALAVNSLNPKTRILLRNWRQPLIPWIYPQLSLSTLIADDSTAYVFSGNKTSYMPYTNPSSMLPPYSPPIAYITGGSRQWFEHDYAIQHTLTNIVFSGKPKLVTLGPNQTQNVRIFFLADWLGATASQNAYIAWTYNIVGQRLNFAGWQRIPITNSGANQICTVTLSISDIQPHWVTAEYPFLQCVIWGWHSQSTGAGATVPLCRFLVRIEQ